MKTTIQQTILRTHFVALALAIVNAVFKFVTVYSLAANIEFIVEMITVLSGLLLFFLYRKQFKNLSTYFSIYPVASILLIAALALRGIMGVFIISVLIFPIIPDQQEYTQDGITIYTPFKGFMTPCCPYQVRERKLLFFEKDLGDFDSEGGGPIDYETVQMKQTDEEIVLTFETGFDKGVVKKKVISR